MDAITSTDHRDGQDAVVSTLEFIVSINQEAIEYLRSGDERMAVVVLKEALSLLSLTARVDGYPDAPPPEPDEVVDSLPYGLAIFNLPSDDDTPCAVITTIDNGTFALRHGVRCAERLLTALTLYHIALAIHRGCCPLGSMNRLELPRSNELYQLCGSAFAQAPELRLAKGLLDANIGHLHSMFDCPAAA
jgi:hypothetical protein